MPKQTLSPNIQEQLHQAALLLQEHGELITHELAQRLNIKVYNLEGKCTYEARHLFSALDNDARFEVIRGRLDTETAPARVRLAHPAKAPEPTLQEQADQSREAQLNRAIDKLLAEGKPFSLREVCRRAGASLGEIHRFPAVKARALQAMAVVINRDTLPDERDRTQAVKAVASKPPKPQDAEAESESEPQEIRKVAAVAVASDALYLAGLTKDEGYFRTKLQQVDEEMLCLAQEREDLILNLAAVQRLLKAKGFPFNVSSPTSGDSSSLQTFGVTC